MQERVPRPNLSIETSGLDGSFCGNMEDLDLSFKVSSSTDCGNLNCSFDGYKERLRNIDEVINNKISVGMKKIMQMIIKKIVVLIEDRVK